MGWEVGAERVSSFALLAQKKKSECSRNQDQESRANKKICSLKYLKITVCLLGFWRYKDGEVVGLCACVCVCVCKCASKCVYVGGWLEVRGFRMQDDDKFCLLQRCNGVEKKCGRKSDDMPPKVPPQVPPPKEPP